MCGDCPTCRARIAEKLKGGAPRRKPCAKLTAEQLERHAKKYGPEGVAETAAELGVDGVDLSEARPPRRPRLRRRSS